MKKRKNKAQCWICSEPLGRQQHPEDDGAPPTLLPQNYTEHLSSQLPLLSTVSESICIILIYAVLSFSEMYQKGIRKASLRLLFRSGDVKKFSIKIMVTASSPFVTLALL